MSSHQYQAFVFSAATRDDLIRKVDTLLNLADAENEFRSALHTASKFGPRGCAGAGFVLKPGDNPAAYLHEMLAALRNGQPSGSVVLGVTRPEASHKNVCILFPGLGVQYPGMGLSLKKCFTPAQRIFARADLVGQRTFGAKISDLIDRRISRNGLAPEATLTLSQFSNPAILTVSLALLEILRSVGLKPNCTIGASLGEYGSLVSAGVLSFEDAVELVYEFGRLAVETTLASKMAAVLADQETVEGVLAGVKDPVEIANYNSQGQFVITGTKRGVEQAVLDFNAKGIVAVPLRISVGYHCHLVNTCNRQFLPYLDRASWRTPLLDVYSTVGESGLFPKKNSINFARTAMRNMLVEKVHFQKQVEAVQKTGQTVFIDLSPTSVMADLVHDLGGEAYGLLRPSDDELLYFMRSVLCLSMVLPEIDATILNDIRIDDQDGFDKQRTYDGYPFQLQA